MKPAVENISKVKILVMASRPKTLPAALVPVIVGTSIALNDSAFKPAAAVIALFCSVLIQIGTNFVNDLYDYLAGTDKADRPGPTRVLAAGLMTVTEMRIAIVAAFGLAFLAGLYLVYLGGWIALAIGIVSITAGVLYTAGPFPLAYNGLGDIFVFIFFGFVGTLGTYYVQALDISPLAFWGSIPVGALITNILVINNYRDRDEDREAGKNTLAVIFGESFARSQYILFTLLAYATPFIVYFTYKSRLFIFLPLLSLPLAIRLVRMLYTRKGEELNKTLELTAKLSAVYGLLFAAGILI